LHYHLVSESVRCDPHSSGGGGRGPRGGKTEEVATEGEVVREETKGKPSSGREKSNKRLPVPFDLHLKVRGGGRGTQGIEVARYNDRQKVSRYS
jgi:hypothetical protein